MLSSRCKSDLLGEQEDRQQAGHDRQNFVDSREEEMHVQFHLRTGRIESAYAAGKASANTRTVERHWPSPS